jgi:hypothetical protein
MEYNHASASSLGHAMSHPSTAPLTDQALALANSGDFSEDAQIAWAASPRPALLVASIDEVEALSQALADALERGACPEFVCGLLLDGADPSRLDGDGFPLWRRAAQADAGRDPGDRCAWLVAARLALGPGFLKDPKLGDVQNACAQCVDELGDLLGAQNDHFALDPEGSCSGELYATLDARHDCALSMLAQEVARLRSARRDAQ